MSGQLLARRAKERRDARLGLIATSVILLSVVGAYEVATDLGHFLDPLLFPGLSKTIPAIGPSLPKLLKGLESSVALLIPSYLLALTLGIAIGVATGMHRTVRVALLPLFRAASPIPPTMLVPYAIAILPTFWLSSAFIVFVAALWPVLMGTIHGVTLIEPRWIDNARCIGLKGWPLVRKVIVPAAMPSIFAGASMALIFGFILLTVAEMFGAKSGLGYFIQYHADFADYPKVIVGMVFLSVVIIATMAAFDRLEASMLHWTKNRWER